jgi:hypothetical protein
MKNLCEALGLDSGVVILVFAIIFTVLAISFIRYCALKVEINKAPIHYGAGIDRFDRLIKCKNYTCLAMKASGATAILVVGVTLFFMLFLHMTGMYWR